jgi:large subunit ribosomal protein L21
MFAVIKTGGKQYKVQEGDVLSVEKIIAEKGQKVGFDRVLLIDDGEKTLIGTPVIENARVQAEVLENFKGKKVLIFKKKRRKQYRRTRGHRQDLTLVKIDRIVPDWSGLSDEERTRLETQVERKEEPKAEVKKVTKREPKPKREPEAKDEAKKKPAGKKKEVTKPAAKPKKPAAKKKE